MKGLILKDIYSVRFQILGGIAIMLLPNLLLVLAGGDLSGEEGMSVGVLNIVVYGGINYITVTLCSSFMLNTLEFDEKSGWARIQRAMPVTDGQIIAGKLIAMGAVLGILTGLSLICNSFGIVVFGISAEPLIAMPLIAALLQGITLSVCFAVGYRYGSRCTLIVYIIVELIVVAGIALLLIGLIQEKISDVMLRAIVYGAVPAFTAAVTALCFTFGKKAVMRDI